MVCEHEFMVGFALAAAKRQWPQPLVIRDGKLHLTQTFVDFHQDEVVRHGMLRSKTTYKYVRSVIERYNEWTAIY